MKVSLILIMFSLLTLFGCKKNIMSEYPEYAWNVSESAPEEYVFKILSGQLNLIDGSAKGIPTRVVLNNGWGIGRSTIASGPDALPLPTSFEITWFSYREDTFFRGEFELPYDHIAATFADKQEDPYRGVPAESGQFTVGVAPEGFVTVWMNANYQSEVIFTGFAKPVEGIPWSAVFSNPDFTKEEIMKRTINEAREDAKGSIHIDDPQYWQRLHKELYNYDIIIESDYTPYEINPRFHTETHQNYFFKDSSSFQKEQRSVLHSIGFTYTFPERNAVVSIPKIDSGEMYNAFRTLSKNSDSRIRVVITMHGDLSTWKYHPTIKVENDNEVIHIKKFRFRAVDNSEVMKHLKGNKNMQRYMNKPGQPANP